MEKLLLEVAALKKALLALPNAKVLADICSEIEKINKMLLALDEKMLFKANGEISIETGEQLKKRNCDYLREFLLLETAIVEVNTMADFCDVNDQAKKLVQEMGADMASFRNELHKCFCKKDSEYTAFIEIVSGEFEYPPETKTAQKRIAAKQDAIDLKIEKLQTQANLIRYPLLGRSLKKKG